METNQLKEISVNSFFITTPKSAISRTPSSINDKANTTCNSIMYEHWAKPITLQLNVSDREKS